MTNLQPDQHYLLLPASTPPGSARARGPYPSFRNAWLARAEWAFDSGQPMDAAEIHTGSALASDFGGNFDAAVAPVGDVAGSTVLRQDELDRALNRFSGSDFHTPEGRMGIARAILELGAHGGGSAAGPNAQQWSWTPTSIQSPAWTDDPSIRVLCLCEHDDFQGAKLFDIPATDFHGFDPEQPDDVGTEVTKVCTRWVYVDAVMPARA